MSEKRPYRSKFGHFSKSYQQKTNYFNRSYSGNDRNKIYNERDYSDSGRNNAPNTDWEYNTNQDRSHFLSRNRDSTKVNEGNNYSNQSKIYPIQEGNNYSNQSKIYPIQEGNNYSNQSKRYPIQDSFSKSYSQSEANNLFNQEKGDSFSREGNYSFGTGKNAMNQHTKYSSSQNKKYSFSDNDGKYSKQGSCIKAYSQNNTSDLHSSKRNNSFNAEDKFYLDMDRSCATNQDRLYSSNKDKEYSFNDDDGDYSKQDRFDKFYSQRDSDDFYKRRDNSLSSEKKYSLDADISCATNRNRLCSSKQNEKYSFNNDNGDYSKQANAIKSYSQSNMGDLYNKERHNEFNSERNYSLDTNRSCAANQDILYSSSQNREYSCNNDDGRYSKPDNTIKSHSQNNGIFYKEERDNSFNSEGKYSLDAGRSFTSNQDRLYSSNQVKQIDFSNLLGNYTNDNKEYSTQDNSGLGFNENKMWNKSFSQSNISEEPKFARSNNLSKEPQNDRFSLPVHNVRNKQLDKNQPWRGGNEFGQMKRERESVGNTSGNPINEFKRFKREDNNEKVENYRELKVKVEEAQSHNELEIPAYSEFANKLEPEEDYIENDYSYNENYCKKVNTFVPDIELVNKYKYFPPSAEEMGNIFKDLVIFFFYKKKCLLEKNPFVIICDSFRKSNKFAPLTIEDGYDRRNKSTKFCTIRWNGMMMVRGVGYSGVFKEPRVVAAVELINQLAMSCYSLKVKNSYYGKDSLESLVKGKEKWSFIRVVEPKNVKSVESARGYIFNFFRDDNDHEIIFKPSPFTMNLKNWAARKGFDVRLSETMFLGVSQMRTPQYWRDKILASGKMENERFLLIPPQGYGNLLLDTPGFRSYNEIKRAKNVRGKKVGGRRTIYATDEYSLQIMKTIPPWERVGGGKKAVKKRKKMVKIQQAIQGGQPANEITAFRHLKPRDKKKVQEKCRVLY